MKFFIDFNFSWEQNDLDDFSNVDFDCIFCKIK